MCMHFTLENVLQFRLTFLWSLLFYFLCSLMAFSGPWICRDCKFVGISSPYSPLWLTYFSVAKMSKAQWDRDRTTDTIMENSVLHGQPLLFYSDEQCEPKKQHCCSLCWLALSRVTNTRQPVTSKLLYKHDILWYIVLRLFLFPTPTFWHTFGSITLYLNTVIKFLK